MAGQTQRRLVLGFAGAVVALLAFPIAARATTIEYTTPCTPQIFTVPAGVTSLSVEAFGAQGGAGAGMSGLGNFGGYAAATLTVIPGSSIQVNVGGQGGSSSGGAGTGGCNGGGTGGILGGGGGGGASDVRWGGITLDARVVVAGGGGGGGGGSCALGGTGGAGGGLTGGDGTGSGTAQCSGGGGGGGGTQAAGGSAGSGAFGATAGVLGVGGTGGNPPGPSSDVGGGGGGGGYYGGGGGGASSGAAGGGGGGSGLVPAGGTIGTGLRAGDGLVRITYGPTAVTVQTLAASATKHGVVVRWRTASEFATLGFHVYRDVNGKRTRVTRTLVRAGRATSGGHYSFVDRGASKTKGVRYWIQAVATDGSRSWYGPTRVTSRR